MIINSIAAVYGYKFYIRGSNLTKVSKFFVTKWVDAQRGATLELRNNGIGFFF